MHDPFEPRDGFRQPPRASGGSESESVELAFRNATVLDRRSEAGPFGNQGVAEDVRLNAWGAFVALPHPEVGARRHVGAPWRFSHGKAAVERAPPRLYADTDRVLGEILGYGERDIRWMREVGAIA